MKFWPLDSYGGIDFNKLEDFTHPEKWNSFTYSLFIWKEL
jgi:hypothetical protein